jgi:hypothetical protein
MNNLTDQVMVIGGLALACAILYAAWHEYSEKNPRDAKLLAAVGAVSLMGSVAAWLQ